MIYYYICFTVILVLFFFFYGDTNVRRIDKEVKKELIVTWSVYYENYGNNSYRNRTCYWNLSIEKIVSNNVVFYVNLEVELGFGIFITAIG